MGYKTKEEEQAYYEANREVIIQRAKDHYWNNRDEKRRYIADRMRDGKIRAVMVLGGRCQQCGWNDHPAGLQFHHREPDQKKFSINANVITSPKKYPWEIILEEIMKCDLLCANCHFVEGSAWDLEGAWPA